MGKYRDHRQPRRDSFENDSNDERSEPSYFQRPSENSTPPSAPVRAELAAQAVRPVSVPNDEPAPTIAEVVWFNAVKGFGFVKPADGQDAYIHVNTLQAAGLEGVAAGDKLTVQIGQGPRGQQVAKVFSTGRERQADIEAAPVTQISTVGQNDSGAAGTVRFYDAVRGFGFVGMGVGGGDVFVHASTLARAGLTTLELGQKVAVNIKQTQKGREAASIQLF